MSSSLSSLEFRPNSIDFLNVNNELNSRIKCVAAGIVSLEGIYGNNCYLTGIQRPLNPYDAVNKAYLDSLVEGYLNSLTVCHILNTTPSTSADTGALVVDGGAGIKGALYCANAIHCQALYTTSDLRLKRNIAKVAGSKSAGLAKISAYEYYLHDKPRIGLLAQELLSAGFDRCVHLNDATLGVDYQAVIALLVSELNALRARVIDVEKKVVGDLLE